MTLQARGYHLSEIFLICVKLYTASNTMKQARHATALSTTHYISYNIYYSDVLINSWRLNC